MVGKATGGGWTLLLATSLSLMVVARRRTRSYRGRQ